MHLHLCRLTQLTFRNFATFCLLLSLQALPFPLQINLQSITKTKTRQIEIRIMSKKFVKLSGEKWIFTKIRQVQRGKVKNGLKRQFLHTWEAWVCISLSFLEMSERRICASREICSNCSSSARVWNTEFYGIITLFQNTSFLKWLIICSKVKDC